MSAHVADVADEAAVRRAAEAVGGWEVLILNAGVSPKPGPIAETSIGEWWTGFEVGSYQRIPAQHVEPPF